MFLNKLAGAALIALAAVTSAQATTVVDVEGLGGDPEVSVPFTLTDPNSMPYQSYWTSDASNPVLSDVLTVSAGQAVNFSLTTADLGYTDGAADTIQLKFFCPTGLCYTDVYSSATYGTDLTSSNPWLSAGGVSSADQVSYPQSIWLTAYAPTGATGVQMVVMNGDEVNAAIGSVQVVPEPETYAMLMAGLGVMGYLNRRRKTQSQD